MSSALSVAPEPGPRDQEVATLTQADRLQVRKLLGNPLEFPAVYNGWLESHLDTIYQRKGVSNTGRPVAGTSLAINGNATITGTLAVSGAATISGTLTTVDISARDYYGRNETLTGALSVAGTATVGALTSSGTVRGAGGSFNGISITGGDISGSGTTDCYVRNYYGSGISLSGSGGISGGFDIGGNSSIGGTVSPGGLNVAGGLLSAYGNAIGFFGKSPVGRWGFISNPGTDGTSLQGAVNQLLGMLRNYGLTPVS